MTVTIVNGQAPVYINLRSQPGSTGATGSTGPAGATGPTGATGPGLTIVAQPTAPANTTVLWLDTDEPAPTVSYAAARVRRFKTGLYYSASDAMVSDGSGAPSTGLSSMITVPMTVGATTTFDRIGLEVVAFIATGLYRLGIYADTGSCFPGALLLDAGTIDCSTNGAKELVIALTLPPGIYWVAACPQVAAATVRTRTITHPWIGISVINNANQSAYCTTATITGAFPNPFPVGGAQAQGLVPKVMLRAA